MNLFNEKIKKSNVPRTTILFLLAVLWRIGLGSQLEVAIKDAYIFPILGFCLAAIIVGELTRRMYRFLKPMKEKRMSSHIFPKSRRKLADAQKDKEALNFGIFWALIWAYLGYF